MRYIECNNCVNLNGNFKDLENTSIKTLKCWKTQIEGNVNDLPISAVNVDNQYGITEWTWSGDIKGRTKIIAIKGRMDSTYNQYLVDMAKCTSVDNDYFAKIIFITTANKIPISAEAKASLQKLVNIGVKELTIDYKKYIENNKLVV